MNGNNNDRRSLKGLTSELKSLLQNRVFQIIIIIVATISFYAFSFHIEQQLLKTLLRDLAIVLGVSIGIPYLHKSLFAENEREILINNFSALFDNKISNIIEDCSKFGFVGFIETMDYKTLFNNLENNQELHWLDTYCPGCQGFYEDYFGALKRGASIRILIIDPACDIAEHRAKEIGRIYEPNMFKHNANDFIKIMTFEADHEIADKIKKAELNVDLEIRSYSDLPCIPMYLILDKNSEDGNGHKNPICGYTSFFLKEPTGIEFVHLKWTSAQGGLLKEFSEYFEQKWSNQDDNIIFPPS